MPATTCSIPTKNVLIKFQHGLYLFGLFCLPAAGFFAPLSITGMNLSMSTALACSVLSGQFFKKFGEVKKNPLVWSILFIFIFAAMTILWGEASWGERLRALHKYDKLLYFIFLIPLCMDNDDKHLGSRARNAAIQAFLVAMTLTVCLSLLTRYAGIGYGRYPSDATWIFHSHIETSYFVAFSAYIFIYRAIYGVRFRWLYFILFLLFTWQEFFINDGRTGWVVYLCLVTLFFVQFFLRQSLQHNPKQAYIALFKGITIGVLASIFLGLSLYASSEKVQTSVGDLIEHSSVEVKNTYQLSVEYRIDFIRASMMMIKEHPIIGMGPGSFPKAFEKITGIPGWGHPHNEYLLTLIHFGLIGLALFLCFFYVQWKMTLKSIPDWPIAQALVFSFMLGACYNAFLYTTVTGNFYVLFLALFFYQCASEKPLLSHKDPK
ncbi:MAG: O-antigen ligase [Gammaproteobacteria bacterium]|nr:O-antigen ligase [Gammaproteobacteria bacterium]